MGVTITANNSKYSFDMGYGGFFSLRAQIALALDKEFGGIYDLYSRCWSPQQYEANDRAAEAIINKQHLDVDYKDVLDFLYMSDSEGEISYRTCRKILDLIKDIDFGQNGFRYALYRHNDYEEFKSFLAECYSKRRKMRWD